MCFSCCFTSNKKQKSDYTLIHSHTTNKQSLHYAAQKGNKKRVKELLRQQPIYIDTENTDGETPLFVAIKNNKKDVATLLLNNGANPNTYNNKGEMPLTFTVEQGSPKRTLLLLEKGAATAIGQYNLENTLVEFYGGTPAHEKVQEYYPFIVPVHAYLLRRKLVPLYEQQQYEQRQLH